MLATILSAFTVADIRKKLGFTALLLLFYRLGSHVPVPGVNTAAVNDIQKQFGGGGVLNLLNTFSGGGLSRIAIFALGIMPYITASIILQLLTVVVPSLEKLQKEGEVGQARITQYTRYLTVALAFAQSIGYVFLFRSFGASAGTPIIKHFDAPHVFLIVISLCAGTILLMWMGELITQRGIGNGISLMIFASIVSRLPNGLQAWWTNDDQVFRVMMPFIALGVVGAVVFIQEGQRRIPVQYAKRVVGRKVYGGANTYLPLRVNTAGVIPVIFASSLILFPATLTRFVPHPWMQAIADALSPGRFTYTLLYMGLIVFFAYFYTAIVFNPIDLADNMKKYGGFIPGIRAGKPTSEYLQYVSTRVTWPGAMYLAVIAIIPMIALAELHASGKFPFGGTTILIMVGVGLETVKQIESQLQQHNYEGFLR